MSSKHKGRPVPAPSVQDWAAWGAMLPVVAQPAPEGAPAAELPPSVQLRLVSTALFRQGLLQFDEEKGLTFGPEAWRDGVDRDFLRAVMQMADIDRANNPLWLLSDDEIHALLPYLEPEGQLLFSSRGFVWPHPNVRDYATAVPLTMYLNLALEAWEIQAGQQQMHWHGMIIGVLLRTELAVRASTAAPCGPARRSWSASAARSGLCRGRWA